MTPNTRFFLSLLQLIFDIACIYEREGSVKLAARRGAKKIFRRQARAACFSNDWTDFLGGSPQLQTRLDAPSSLSL